MRRLIVLCLLGLGIVSASYAGAQPVEVVLIDRTVPPTRGQIWQECPYVDAGVVAINARADGGRSGEAARFLFAARRQMVRPDAYLEVPLGAEPVIASYRVEAGSYCFYVMMTNHYPVPAGTSASDTPVKISTIRITHEIR